MREQKLKQQFNDFWEGLLHTSDDIYSQLNFKQWLELKTALSNVNNIITLKVTNMFVEKLVHDGVVSGDEGKKIMNEVNAQSVNTNGFDVQDDETKILAEVKCNIPIRYGSFGANQTKGVVHDIESLVNGKKSAKLSYNIADYLKFFVMLCSEDDSQRKAMDNIMNKFSDISLIDYKDKQSLVADTSKTVYVVYVKF